MMYIYIPVCVQMSQMSQMSGSHANPRIGAQNRPSCGSIWMRMWSRCWSLGIDTVGSEDGKNQLDW